MILKGEAHAEATSETTNPWCSLEVCSLTSAETADFCTSSDTLGYPVSLHADIILRELCRSPLLGSEQLQRCSVESELWISLLMTAF